MGKKGSGVRGRESDKKELRQMHLMIAQRYEDLCKELAIKCSDRTTTLMDLAAVSMAYPNFDWDGLLMADDFNFGHDLGGIKRHIDRTKAFTSADDLDHLFTGCFVPRFASPAASKSILLRNGVRS
jgi:hypothetical protein